MIKQAFCVAAMLAALSTSVSATAATSRDAAFASSADSAHSRPFMFSGATLRLGLGARTESKPQLALRIAGASRSEVSGLKIGEGLALAGSGNGKAKLTIVGQDSKAVTDRLALSDGAKVGLVVGAVALVALVVVVASSGTGDAPAAFFDEE